MAQVVPPARPRVHWPELDLLRGVAAILMVFNHSGVAWLGDKARGGDFWLVFAGGLAPVFFFFVTGVGRGLQSSATGRAGRSSDVFRKVLLLFLADVALWIAPGRFLGMDFLGFIALSTVVVELVQNTRAPRMTAISLLAIVLGVRFVLAPLLDLEQSTTTAQQVLRFLLGDRSLDGFSYPPCPWLAYPLTGYLLGGLVQDHAARVRDKRWAFVALSALLGLAGLGVCAFFRQRGMVFFRWGTLSLAYTVFGFASLSVGMALALALATQQRLSTALSLPGTSSLVVVPLHVVLIDLVAPFSPNLAASGGFALVASLTTLTALYGSRAIDRAIGRLARSYPGSSALWWSLAGAAILLTVATGLATSSLSRTVWMVLAQLTVCVLFPMPWPRRAEAN